MSWPSYARIQAAGLRLGEDAGVERTPFDDGFVRQAPRYSSALRTLSIVAEIDDARIEDFRRWARDQSAQWFRFPGLFEAGQIQARVRNGAGGIEYEVRRTLSGSVYWRAQLVLESTQF